jgi:hypothetical protein
VELEETDPDRKQFLQIHRELYSKTADSAQAERANIQLKMLHLLANSKEGKKTLQDWLDSEEESKRTQQETGASSPSSSQQIKKHGESAIPQTEEQVPQAETPILSPQPEKVEESAIPQTEDQAPLIETRISEDGNAEAEQAVIRPPGPLFGPQRASEMQHRIRSDDSSSIDSQNENLPSGRRLKGVLSLAG